METKVLTQPMLDELQQTATIQGIPLADLVGYCTKKYNDEGMWTAFNNDAQDVWNYINQIMNTMIDEFHNNVLTEFEVFIAGSTQVKVSKNDRKYNSTIGYTKDGEKIKYLLINDFTDEPKTYKALDTGIMTLSADKETNEVVVIAQAKSNTKFTPKKLVWCEDPLAFLKKVMRKSTIAEANKNISAKDEKGYTIKYSLRYIDATIINVGNVIEKTRSVNIKIADESIKNIPDFGKNRIVQDPKDSQKTITIYGGFGGFADKSIKELYASGTKALFVGNIRDEHNMDILSIIPIYIKPYLKPTQKLNIPPLSGVIVAKPEERPGVDISTL